VDESTPVSELKNRTELHAAGALTDEEFALKKAQLAAQARAEPPSGVGSSYHRIQALGAWCGPVMAVLLLASLGLWATVFLSPTEHPSSSLIQTSTVLFFVRITLIIPYSLVVSQQLRRMEQQAPILSILQFACVVGQVATVVLAKFLADANQLGKTATISLLLVVGQLGAVALAIWRGQRTSPVFPRWAAHYSIWTGVLMLPGFWINTPRGWEGIFGYWIPSVVLAAWYLVMTAPLLRAIRDDAGRVSSRAEPPGAITS
jgi:hypothetical protein